jgi:hypothetical protein
MLINKNVIIAIKAVYYYFSFANGRNFNPKVGIYIVDV